MSLLQVANVSKSFAETPVLHDVSLEVQRGEIVCLLGPSGCGKTTLLRIVAGLETPDAGAVFFDGRNLADVPVYRRGFGLMFQEYVLFPHKNVFENVAFGLRMAGLEAEAIRRRVAEMLALVDLTGYEQRQVHELSGGQQQRVALARSLAPNPQLLMLDEPLGSLDRTLREELMVELRRILKSVMVAGSGEPGLTALYVTHDQQEAFAIADRVIILNAGRIEQIGAPQTVYRRPASPFVARFLGMHNLLPGQVLTAPPRPLVSTAIGELACHGCREGIERGQRVTVLVRPDAANLVPSNVPADDVNLVTGSLAATSFRGSQVRIRLAFDPDTRFVFELPGAAADDLPPVGRPLRLRLDPDALSLLPRDQGPSAPTESDG